MSLGLGFPLPGVLAEFRVFDAKSLVPCPPHLTSAEACTLPIAAVTAWMAMNSLSSIGSPIQGKEKNVLLQGTGGVSIAGLQIAKAMNMTTIITSSSDSKLERAKQLGADHVINYKTIPQWNEEVLRVTEGKGVDIILEIGGAQKLEKSLECIKFGGLISAIGYVSGKEDTKDSRINVNVLALRRNVTLKGIINGPKDRFEEVLEYAYAENKGIRPVIDRVFEFDRAREALEYLETGKHFGKVVIRVH